MRVVRRLPINLSGVRVSNTLQTFGKITSKVNRYVVYANLVHLARIRKLKVMVTVLG